MFHSIYLVALDGEIATVVAPPHTDLATIEEATRGSGAQHYGDEAVDVEPLVIGVDWIPCNCESSLCRDHGADETWHRCPHAADPRVWCRYIGGICTQCAANMAATGGGEYLSLADYVVETRDVDCDGIGYGWHLVQGEPADHAEAHRMIGSPPVTVTRVMTLAEFEAEIGREMNAFGREHWAEEGYCSSVHSFTDGALV